MNPEEILCELKAINKTCDTTLFVTSRAIQSLISLQQEEHNSPSPPRFRIRVDSGGCAGFQYHFNFDHIQNQEDVIFRTDSIEIIIDDISLTLLNGVILDYVEDMMSASFQLKNPNASSSCGCGNSFSI